MSLQGLSPTYPTIPHIRYVPPRSRIDPDCGLPSILLGLFGPDEAPARA
jgi:hypothetical protein